MSSRAAIYARLSRDPTGAAESVDRQLADCRALAAREGWAAVTEYVDRDRSAYQRGVEREAYDQMFADVEAGRIDVVIAWKPDRLARRALDMAKLRDLLERTGAR